MSVSNMRIAPRDDVHEKWRDAPAGKTELSHQY
jgi:hypothetical protein